MKHFFKYWFPVAHPELFDKIGVTQKNLVTHPSTKVSNVDSYMGNIGFHFSQSPKNL